MSPAMDAANTPSLIGPSVAVPLATGASLIAVMDMLRVTVFSL